MKKILMAVIVTLTAVSTFAAPIRVALLDFQDQTGVAPDQLLGGAIRPGALAEKGVYLVTKQLVGKEGFVLIDRRDFIAQMEALQPKDAAEPTPTKPTFIHAAQALNADIVLRGTILTLSTGGQKVNQGGFQADFTTLSLRVGLEAIDPVDGSVIAMAEGAVQDKFRQTAALQTVLSEDDVLQAFDKALAKAVPEIEKALTERTAAQAARPKVKLSITTSADPALVEIDGILVGTTPIADLAVYQGDHILTVGKAGYRDITKRIMFEKDSKIEVPMIRTELSAEEMKDVLEKMRMSVIVGEPGLVIHTIQDSVTTSGE